jgi:hypothetical protein
MLIPPQFFSWFFIIFYPGNVPSFLNQTSAVASKENGTVDSKQLILRWQVSNFPKHHNGSRRSTPMAVLGLFGSAIRLA